MERNLLDANVQWYSWMLRNETREEQNLDKVSDSFSETTEFSLAGNFQMENEKSHQTKNLNHERVKYPKAGCSRQLCTCPKLKYLA